MPGKGAFYYINHHNSGTSSGLPDSILKPVEVGKSYIPQKKPYNVLFERSFEAGRISAMKDSRRV